MNLKYYKFNILYLKTKLKSFYNLKPLHFILLFSLAHTLIIFILLITKYFINI